MGGPLFQVGDGRIILTNLGSKLLRRVLWLASALAFWGCGNDLEKARECFRIGDLPRSRVLFEKVMDKNPTSFDARYGYALVLQESALRKRALGLDGLEDWSTVVDAYEVCSKVRDVRSMSSNYALSLFHLANKLHAMQRPSEALEYLKQARTIDSRNIFVLNLAGIVEYDLGRFREAQETFEFLLALDPRFTSAYLNLGNVFWESGSQDEALAVWKQGLAAGSSTEVLSRRIESAIQQLSER